MSANTNDIGPQPGPDFVRHDTPAHRWLEKANAAASSDWIHGFNVCASEADAEIERLRARVAELEQDAKRYRYLSGQIKSDPDMSGNHRWWRLQPYQQLRGPTIHDAIDAALAKDATP